MLLIEYDSVFIIVPHCILDYITYSIILNYITYSFILVIQTGGVAIDVYTKQIEKQCPIYL